MIRPSFLPALLSVTLFSSHSFASSDSGFYLGIDLATSIAWQKISMDNGYYTETVQLSHSYSSLNFGAAFKF